MKWKANIQLKKKEYINSEYQKFQAIIDDKQKNEIAFNNGKIDGKDYHSIINEERKLNIE